MSSADSFRGPLSVAKRGSEPDSTLQLGPAETAKSEPAPREFRGLFEAHYASIWRLLRRLGVAHAELDDAAQEVFWVAARRQADIEPGREHAFLYGVALRVASNLLRRQRELPAAEEQLTLELAAREASPEQALAERQARALLDSVLGRLPLELRTVFVLFELEGLQIRDIAELEQLPLGTVGSRLRRAREEFSAIAKRVRATLLARGGTL